MKALYHCLSVALRPCPHYALRLVAWEAGRALYFYGLKGGEQPLDA